MFDLLLRAIRKARVNLVATLSFWLSRISALPINLFNKTL
jgi:hypothetical protein